MSENIYERKNKAKTFKGKPCRKCKQTLRYLNSKECVSCNKASQQRYYQSTKGKEKWKRLKQSLKHRTTIQQYEQSIERKAGYKRRNASPKYKAVQKAHRHKILAQRKNADGFYTAQEWIALKEQYNNFCLCCKKHEKELQNPGITADHIVPLSRGGTNYIINIQPLCLPCNRKNWSHYLKFGFQIDYRP